MNSLIGFLRNMPNDKQVAFIFGRFQPPTRGHARLVKVLRELKWMNYDVFIFPSHSEDRTHNPLPFYDKVKIIAEAFPDIDVVSSESIRTIFHILSYFQECGRRNITMVAGDDRSESFRKMVKPYIVSASVTVKAFLDIEFTVFDIPREQYTTKFAASDARMFALSGLFEQFIRQLPETLSIQSAEHIYDAIRNRREPNDVQGIHQQTDISL